MPKVFISYTHADADHVAGLKEVLKNLDVTGWLDQADLSAGDALSSAVRTSLQKSSAILVVLTPNALKSQWVQFEVGAAEALEKTIIPIVVAGDRIEEGLPEILKNRVWIDARHKSSEDVARELNRILESVAT